MGLIALALVVLAVAGLVAAILTFRSLGARYRIARVLWAVPSVTIAEAREGAHSRRPRYVRVHGRISSDEEFPDEHDRPLVFRRTRIEVGSPGRWRVIDEDRAAVAFGIEQRTEFIRLDVDALDEGLVVVPRESTGRVADLPVGLRAGPDPAAHARLVIEQVSAVEHATAAGTPMVDARGEPVLSAGLGRPLILTTLELPAAMRLLAGDRRGRLVGGALLALASLGALAAAGVAFVLGA